MTIALTVILSILGLLLIFPIMVLIWLGCIIIAAVPLGLGGIFGYWAVGKCLKNKKKVAKWFQV